jgi:hypothetical protein
MIPLRTSFSIVTRRRFVVAFCALAMLVLAILLHSSVPRRARAGAGTSQRTVVANTTAQVRPIGCCGGDAADEKPHLLAGSYYTLRNNYSAKLLLNNKGPRPIEVQPTLFSLSGERFDASRSSSWTPGRRNQPTYRAPDCASGKPGGSLYRQRLWRTTRGAPRLD